MGRRCEESHSNVFFFCFVGIEVRMGICARLLRNCQGNVAKFRIAIVPQVPEGRATAMCDCDVAGTWSRRHLIVIYYPNFIPTSETITDSRYEVDTYLDAY